MCTADLGFTGGKNDIGAGTDTDFIGACTPALRMIKSRIKRWVGQVTCLGKSRGAYRGLVWKSKGNRPCLRLENNIKMDLQGI